MCPPKCQAYIQLFWLLASCVPFEVENWEQQSCFWMTKTLSYLDLLGVYQRDLEEHWFPCPSLAFSLCEVTGQQGHVPTTPRSRKKKRDAISWELHGALSPPHCCPRSSTAHPHPVTGALPSRLFFPIGGRNPCLPVLSFWNFYFKLVDKKFVSLQHAQTYFCCGSPSTFCPVSAAGMRLSSVCPVVFFFNTSYFPHTYTHNCVQKNRCFSFWIWVTLFKGIISRPIQSCHISPFTAKWMAFVVRSTLSLSVCLLMGVWVGSSSSPLWREQWT